MGGAVEWLVYSAVACFSISTSASKGVLSFLNNDKIKATQNKCEVAKKYKVKCDSK